MTLYYEHAGITLHLGDVREVLRDLPAESVHCCVTSPPYFNLRDYGIAGQIGLEPTPAEYVVTMVDVFREVARVLHPTGTLWANLGDSYSTHAKGNPGDGINGGRFGVAEPGYDKRGALPEKNLLGMPWRLAFALQEDGWILRSEITWCKKACMPESVTDRPTSATEKIFLFTKQGRYYYDSDAVRESAKYGHMDWQTNAYGRLRESDPRDKRLNERGSHSGLNDDPSAGRNLRNYWLLGPEPMDTEICLRCAAVYDGAHHRKLRRYKRPDGTEGRRCACGADDWSSHFAVFPTEIPKRAILAGTSEAGVCPTCRRQWVRVTKPSEAYAKHLGKDWADNEQDKAEGRGHFALVSGSESGQRPVKRNAPTLSAEYITTGWRPSCQCPEHLPVPAVVLDPFSGSGTTVAVAKRLGRHGVGIDLKAEYHDMATRRLRQDVLIMGV